MIHTVLPEKFNPIFEVVACFLENDGKILLLHRLEGKSEGGKWGLPAGKINEGESRDDALKREVYEETGIDIEKQKIEFLGTLAVTHGERDFLYHSFQIELSSLLAVTISESEHQGYAWKTVSEALEMPLVTDLDYCIKKYKRI